MRIARKLVLMAVVIALGAAAVAPGASALSALEITDEGSAGAHCPSVTATGGGCLAHFEGTADLTAHFLGFGILEASCTTEVELRIDEDAAGGVTKITNTTPGNSNCGTVAPGCSLPWFAQGEEVATDVIDITVSSVCIDPSESDQNCTGTFTIRLSVPTSEDTLLAETVSPQKLGQCEIEYSGSVEHTSGSYVDVHPSHL
jgi:hypothetical protein